MTEPVLAPDVAHERLVVGRRILPFARNVHLWERFAPVCEAERQHARRAIRKPSRARLTFQPRRRNQRHRGARAVLVRHVELFDTFGVFLCVDMVCGGPIWSATTVSCMSGRRRTCSDRRHALPAERSRDLKRRFHTDALLRKRDDAGLLVFSSSVCAQKKRQTCRNVPLTRASFALLCEDRHGRART